MSCIALIRTGVVQSAADALSLYDRKRVTNNRGLTVTSQRKFVMFYEELWRKFWNVKGNIGDIPADNEELPKWIIPQEPYIGLFGIEVVNISSNSIDFLRIKVYKGSNFAPTLIYDSGKPGKGVSTFDCDCVIQGNFKVLVEDASGFRKFKVFELWHNTLFMNRL
jgi:hypothetical protein